MHSVVYSIFFLETVQTALSGADLYYWFATGFGNVERLAGPYASFFDVPILGSVVSLCVQFFFVYRILALSKKRSWWLCAIICLVAFVFKRPRTSLSFFLQLSVVSSLGAFAAGIFVSLPPFHVTQHTAQLL
jgi:hypothetical protein